MNSREIAYIECKMEIENSFRSMHRRLFAIQTENNFWKRIVCELSLKEIETNLVYSDMPMSDLDEEILQMQDECMLEYMEKYGSARSFRIDTLWIQKEFEAMMNSKLFGPHPEDFDEWARMEFNYRTCITQILNLCPIHHSMAEHGFFRIVKEMGMEAYVETLENRYFLMKKFYHLCYS